MCEEKYKFLNKILDEIVLPFFRWICRIFQKKKTRNDKIKEMYDFITALSSDNEKIIQLNEIMNMPDFGNNLRKKIGKTKKDIKKIFFIRFLGMKPNLERWLCEEWTVGLPPINYISIHPLFFKAYKKWQKKHITKNRKNK